MEWGLFVGTSIRADIWSRIFIKTFFLKLYTSLPYLTRLRSGKFWTIKISKYRLGYFFKTLQLVPSDSCSDLKCQIYSCFLIGYYTFFNISPVRSGNFNYLKITWVDVMLIISLVEDIIALAIYFIHFSLSAYLFFYILFVFLIYGFCPIRMQYNSWLFIR